MLPTSAWKGPRGLPKQRRIVILVRQVLTDGASPAIVTFQQWPKIWRIIPSAKEVSVQRWNRSEKCRRRRRKNVTESYYINELPIVKLGILIGKSRYMQACHRSRRQMFLFTPATMQRSEPPFVSVSVCVFVCKY